MTQRLATDSFAQVAMLSEPRLSPDGRRLVYSRTTVDLEANDYVSHLWHVDPDTGERFQLTNGRGESRPVWLDGDRLAYVEKPEAGENQDPYHPHSELRVIDCRGGEGALLFEVDLAVQALWPLASGQYLLLANVRPELEALAGLEAEAREAAIKRLRERDEDCEVLEHALLERRRGLAARPAYAALPL